MTHLAPTPDREFAFEDSHFQMIAKIIRERAGINLPETKKSLVYSRLAKRIRLLNLEGFESYCQMLSHLDDHDEEIDLFISALTTNVTRFFREAHHFDTLRETVLPDLVAKARAGARVRIWSSACSSGEELYSLALTVLETCPEAARYDIRILGTDIDPKIVERARRGVYPASVLEDIPQALKGHLMRDGDDSVTVSDDLRKLVTINRLNLIGPWPFKGPFDVIFCRNVTIYFDREVQEALWQEFSRVLGPQGWLMIGHSERVSGPAVRDFSNAGITTYRKNTADRDKRGAAQSGGI